MVAVAGQRDKGEISNYEWEFLLWGSTAAAAAAAAAVVAAAADDPAGLLHFAAR
jgi:hypothetical protein